MRQVDDLATLLGDGWGWVSVWSPGIREQFSFIIRRRLELDETTVKPQVNLVLFFTRSEKQPIQVSPRSVLTVFPI